MKFQTNVCPLCDKVLKFHQVAKVNVYSCHTHTPYGKSHYEVEYDKHAVIQHVYIGEWCIDNFENMSKSRIYRRERKADGEKWLLVADHFYFSLDTEENMLAKLNKLQP